MQRRIKYIPNLHFMSLHTLESQALFVADGEIVAIQFQRTTGHLIPAREMEKKNIKKKIYQKGKRK
jgi:hypothetical protein